MTATLAALILEMGETEKEIRLGGGEKAAQRQHEKGRLTARERIQALIDPGADFNELGLWAGWGMYQEWGGAPSGGVVTGIGTISEKKIMVIANDATVKAGAFFPITAKKVLRAQRIAWDNRLPLIYLVDSAGVFLPLQDEVFPDEDDFGRIFRNNAVISADGIPQLAAILGNCVAGGGYLPVLCDKLLMTEGSGLYLAGPALVKAAIGQTVSHEELGGALMHSAISGTIDFREKDDPSCLERLRRLTEHFPKDEISLNRQTSPGKDPATFTDIAQKVFSGKEFDIRELILAALDNSPFDEYKAEYGKTLVCGYGKLGGQSIGVVANQKSRQKNAQGGLQYGGVIYTDCAEKAARFVLDCNQTRIPILFLQDVNGFMVGKESEQAGIIKEGAKLVNAVANSVVPKITLFLGGSYGAGNYALCGKAFDPRLLLAWPTARNAVMGAEQAASTLLDIHQSGLKRSGAAPKENELEALREKILEGYRRQADIRYAAARLWIDRIISPERTREELLSALEIALRKKENRRFVTGVLQT
ncbi:MAG: acyl-CoA carboxylase subunit beta [Gemmataceae bacterium]|nr:acyl-CoA carboxylase subunit beta [Gemmataceae bacterium]